MTLFKYIDAAVYDSIGDSIYQRIPYISELYALVCDELAFDKRLLLSCMVGVFEDMRGSSDYIYNVCLLVLDYLAMDIEDDYTGHLIADYIRICEERRAKA